VAKCGHGNRNDTQFLFLVAIAQDTSGWHAYAVWTGVGAAGTVILGILIFGESREVLRILRIVLIVAGLLA
jgi:quaternary ammonium compound-resistance protein SugE